MRQAIGDTATSAAVSAADFRAACGLFPTGVTVVTRTTKGGRPYGMTVSSFTSVSLDPPLILVCIDRRAGFASHLDDNLTFAVNVLKEDQENLAVRFSTPPETGRFDGLAWRQGWSGVPLLSGIVASLACSLERVVEAGDHLIFIGSVREIRLHGGNSLVWCQSNYLCLPPPVERI